jgi:hypothetical protein
MAEQAMDKEKGEKREAGEESEERQLKRQKKESEEEQPMTSSASAGNSSPSANVDKPELDEEGDVVMNVDLGKYFKIVNLDLVNYFCAKQANKIQQEVIGKVYSATLYDENVIEQVINISKASDAKKRAAMARARKTAQIAEVTQSKANLEFMSVYSSDTIDGLPAQCDCYECDVNVTVNLEGKPFMKKARMRSSMKLNRNELRNMSIHANNKVVKAKYAITKNLLYSKLKKSLQDRGRIDEVSRLPIMATDCYWDDLSGKPLDPVLVTKARKEEMEEFNKHMVYTKVPVAKAWSSTRKKPIVAR